MRYRSQPARPFVLRKSFFSFLIGGFRSPVLFLPLGRRYLGSEPLLFLINASSTLPKATFPSNNPVSSNHAPYEFSSSLPLLACDPPHYRRLMPFSPLSPKTTGVFVPWIFLVSSHFPSRAFGLPLKRHSPFVIVTKDVRRSEDFLFFKQLSTLERFFKPPAQLSFLQEHPLQKVFLTLPPSLPQTYNHVLSFPHSPFFSWTAYYPLPSPVFLDTPLDGQV